ncbi:MAG: glycosyltransferase [Gammaproteobacteria bacterium]|nr:glycosyltransferase [Gammaproteobacteria bacterium]
MGLSVTQVMLSKGFGGAERLFVDLCLSLAERGIPTQAVCHQDFVRARDLADHEKIELTAIPVRGNWDFLAERRIRKAIERFRPTIIHSHLARGALYSGRCSRRLCIPLVANLHNYIDLKYYRDVDCFLPGTDDQREYLLAHGVPDRSIRVIPHFTRVQAQDGAADVIRDSGFVAYGRMVRKKGFDVLLHAFSVVHARFDRARLTLGGDGPEMAELQGLARDLGIADAVRFAGWVDNVPEFLARAGTFVLPSLDEPFGIVTLEAMACMKAIIATKTPGPVEVLDESMARLVPIGDAGALAEAMMALHQDEDLRRALAAKAHEHFLETYSEARVIPEFLDIYRGVTDAKSNPQAAVST